MKQWVPTPEAVKLLHDGQIALAEVEAAGIRIDREYLEKALADTQQQITELEAAIRTDPDYKYWRRRYGELTNTGSAEQLSRVLVDELKLKPKLNTAGEAFDPDRDERASASQKSLEAIDRPIVKTYFDAQRLRKGRNTFLVGLWREMVQHADGDWYVHPNFHLNTAITFRSSSSAPNFQNNPTRNPILAEMVRRAVKARRGHQLLELDYGQIEVRVPCAYTFDPSLIAYCTDPSTDMHGDTAAQLFMIEPSQVHKDARDVAKNQYVFPTFYGSFYGQIAPAVWDSIDRRKLKIKDTDVSLRDHLAAQGITKLGTCEMGEAPEPGTFAHHVKQIEDHFWGKRFPVYAKWKRDWVAAYHKHGGCRFLTGFVMQGPHARNDIVNYPIQGAASNLKLWSMVKIVNRLRRYKFRTRVIGEIHDCINFDCWPPERDDVIDMCIEIMSHRAREWATWVNVPLPVEPEACPIDGSWYEKAKLVHNGSSWVPADADKWTKLYGAWA